MRRRPRNLGPILAAIVSDQFTQISYPQTSDPKAEEKPKIQGIPWVYPPNTPLSTTVQSAKMSVFAILLIHLLLQFTFLLSAPSLFQNQIPTAHQDLSQNESVVRSEPFSQTRELRIEWMRT